MSRKPFVAGNWKMFKTAGEGAILVQKLEGLASDYAEDVDILVAPPFTALNAVSNAIMLDKANMKLGAQNVWYEKEGAYTGEIAPRMLKDLDVDYVIIGHSERREYFNETNEILNRKVKAVLEEGMLPIYCCGESDATRVAGKTLSFIESQIREGLNGLSADDAKDIVVAYEPIWAIGTGKTPTPEMAEEVIASIRATLASLFGADVAAGIRILYGGSVKPENARLFFGQENIDGALVGGAALSAEGFGPIIKAAVN